jgi:hypothetical protein
LKPYCPSKGLYAFVTQGKMFARPYKTQEQNFKQFFCFEGLKKMFPSKI